ncbi:MAG: OmpA family protein [Minicystis sp.]
MPSPRLLKRTALSLPVAALLALPATASALEIGGRIEPGVAVPLTSPQSGRFTPGGVMSLKAYVGLGRYFEVQGGVSFLGLGSEDGTVPEGTATAWSNSLGFRLKRPHDAALNRSGFYAGSPWIDADALYVQTGALNRFGLSLGAGVSFPLTKSRIAWLGPFVRYMQIVQPHRDGFDNGDAKLLFVGLNFELGTSPLARLLPAARSAPPLINCPVCAGFAKDQSDRDHDGMADSVDNCPDVAGPLDNNGCPRYKRVTVKPDRLELNEKIMFAFDKSDIEEESLPLLDEVVQALEDNKSFRVQIEGHTDSTGPTDHNQALSEQRALAVLAYLHDHGIASERLTYKGFGESVPTDTNDTVAGRENNRRVDFVVMFKIIDRSVQ